MAPNRSSHALHVPMRTCVICRQKKEKYKLLRFIVMNEAPVWDLKDRIQAHGSYVCDDNACISALSKWVLRKRRKQKNR